MDICIDSVTITPNPVMAGAQFKIEVELYTVFPATNLYPALDLYPAADIFSLYPHAACYPDNNLYPAKGENEI